METVRDNVKNNGVLNGVIDRDLTGYFIHARADVVNEGNRNEWILVTISRNGK